ncbi:MAG: hypothetical protein WC242_02275 [Candidatus Paceibacterota bacterium]|jgi:hypothetical protein
MRKKLPWCFVPILFAFLAIYLLRIQEWKLSPETDLFNVTLGSLALAGFSIGMLIGWLFAISTVPLIRWFGKHFKTRGAE